MTRTGISPICRRRTLGIALSLAIVASLCPAQSPFPTALGLPPAALPEPVHWAQDLFLIPYKWNSAGDPNQARSVQLFISRDFGRSWQEISTAKPDVQYFTYRAPSDGEYWFSIRTIDAAGRAWPEGSHQPELRVVVDTQSPEVLSLEAQLTESGQVTSTWQAKDQHLDSSRVQMQYRTPIQTAWVDVPRGGLRQPAPNRAAGESTWQVPAGTSSVWVRISVRDQAGNGREAGAEARVGVVAPSRGLPAIAASSAGPQLRTADTARLANAAAAEWTALGTSPRPQAALRRAPSLQSWPSDGDSPVPLGLPRTAALPQLPSPSTSFPTTSFPPTSLAGSSDSTGTTAPVRPNPFQYPRTGTSALPAIAASASSRRLPSSPLSASPLPAPSTSSIFSGLDRPEALSSVPPATEAASPSRGRVKRQYLNSLEFEIGYDVDTAGAFGVTRVELWATSDQGRSWKRLAVDSDNRSPIRATVPQQGDYGLKIVIEAAGGIDPEKPRPGDLPEMLVRVDTTPPIAKLTRLEQGEGYFADHLIVSWQASESQGAGDQVSLSYSSQPRGPWVIAASNLRSNGRYAWRLARHLPTQFYVRLEVRDQAGNVATDQSAVPVTIDLPSPVGRLNSARSVGP